MSSPLFNRRHNPCHLQSIYLWHAHCTMLMTYLKCYYPILCTLHFCCKLHSKGRSMQTALNAAAQLFKATFLQWNLFFSSPFHIWMQVSAKKKFSSLCRNFLLVILFFFFWHLPFLLTYKTLLLLCGNKMKNAFAYKKSSVSA